MYASFLRDQCQEKFPAGPGLWESLRSYMEISGILIELDIAPAERNLSKPPENCLFFK